MCDHGSDVLSGRQDAPRAKALPRTLGKKLTLHGYIYPSPHLATTAVDDENLSRATLHQRLARRVSPARKHPRG